MEERNSYLKFSLIVLCALLLSSCFAISNVEAQDTVEDDPSNTEEWGLFFSIIMILMLVIALAISGIWLYILFWVFNDAKGRGVKTPIVWVLLVWAVGAIGLIVYLILRPSGSKYPCGFCGKKSFRAFPECPFCKRKKR